MEAHDKEPDGSPDDLPVCVSGVRNPFLEPQWDADAVGLSVRAIRRAG